VVLPVWCREFADWGSSYFEHSSVTTVLLEFARILINPKEYEKDRTGISRLEARRLRRCHDDAAASRQGVFPGEAGDGEHLLDIVVTTGTPKEKRGRGKGGGGRGVRFGGVVVGLFLLLPLLRLGRCDDVDACRLRWPARRRATLRQLMAARCLRARAPRGPCPYPPLPPPSSQTLSSHPPSLRWERAAPRGRNRDVSVPALPPGVPTTGRPGQYHYVATLADSDGHWGR
jgi:hypothetical protein